MRWCVHVQVGHEDRMDWGRGGGWQRVTSDHVATLVTIKASLKNKIIPLELWRPVRGDDRPAGADVGLHFLLCPPAAASLAFPFCCSVSRCKSGSITEKRLWVAPGAPGRAARRRELDLPQWFWRELPSGGDTGAWKKPQSRLISLKVQ